MESRGQDDSGLKKLLTFSVFYEFLGKLLGSDKARKWLAQNVWKLNGGEAVVDIGCGPGSVLNFLPANVSYWGIDISENYVREARRRLSRGTFFLGTVRDFVNENPSQLNSVDLVLCNGLLHHLSDDEAIEVLELSKCLMKPRGRLTCLEATYLARQTWLSKWIVSTDRGKHVRSEQEWKDLVGRVFSNYSTRVLTGLIRMPYTHIIIECSNDNLVSVPVLDGEV